MSGFKTVTKGIIKENPVFRLVLGTCPTLAVTTSAENALGMGAAVIFVLMGSNVVISLLRKVIPDKVRIPAYITIISGFVTIVQMLIKAYLPAGENLKVTMMDAALKYAEANIPVMPLHWICEGGLCSCKAGSNCDSRESVRYIQAGTRIPLLMLSK